MRSRWSDKEAGRLEGLDALVYATRTIGADPDLVLWGGGNSSVKLTMKDHLGREVRVLWIKGSGFDMRTATTKHFTPLRQDELAPLIERGSMDDEEMVANQAKCVLDTGGPNPNPAADTRTGQRLTVRKINLSPYFRLLISDDHLISFACPVRICHSNTQILRASNPLLAFPI